MIKARGHDEQGRDVLLLGLSYRNLRRLKEDEPIAFDGTPYGFPGQIIIQAGPTEAAMARMIRNYNPTVTVNIEPNEES